MLYFKLVRSSANALTNFPYSYALRQGKIRKRIKTTKN
uniref:Uncharacterized protein n=1 Tax=Vibrio splendidus TaxID=29497 RepID=A0A0H3ZQX3_VIBSP|nr:hypothetical protein [Vibrio splendidus]